MWAETGVEKLEGPPEGPRSVERPAGSHGSNRVSRYQARNDPRTPDPGIHPRGCLARGEHHRCSRPSSMQGSRAPGHGGHPHLWLLLGSPCGAERPPAGWGLPHPLRALSRLQTESLLKGGWEEPGPALTLLLVWERAGTGRRRGTQRHAKKQHHKAGPRA